jgi:signal peptidase I
VSDPHEHIDPLDPRFVDAVLARARRRTVPIEQSVAPANEPPPPPPPPLATSATNPVAAAPVEVAPDEEPREPDPQPPAPAVFSPAESRASVFSPVPEVQPSGDGQPPNDLDDDNGEDDDDKHRRRNRNIIEWIAVAIGAVVVAFLIRAFLLQAFYIPSESMEPTLHKGDRILVNKLSYKVHDVNRGDLVVFEKPPNEPTSNINDLIKRVIARPGETIELRSDGTITIDGRLLNEPYLSDGQPPGPLEMSRSTFVDGACTNPVSEITKCTLGESFVFVMGDNRNHSHDSRAFGPINEDLIVGRAFIKVWPLSDIGFL